jgi:hypothetical protein
MRIAALTNVTDESRTMLKNGLATARTNAGSVIAALPFAFLPEVAAAKVSRHSARRRTRSVSLGTPARREPG